ncbi:hypothetical protein A3844_03235 [Paenibacillus helianthi]|uniref:Teneurin-like YD-shell domain-containing protein n=1 Tax=Paenibacillus helianthi TaxID=1349432 RepID=A0ABX3ETK1_9BACL|nr:hypothetical protein A3844_03235 [Paenibacillus helianthi]
MDTGYTYDLQNTLTSVTKGSSSTNFQYYADGMRYLKTNGNTQTQVNYNFQGQVITEEKIVSGVYTEQANFVRGDRVLVKKDKKASKDYYYLYNGHGDVVQMVDTSGAVVNNYTYDEWGNITSQVEGTSNSFKYTGEVYDAETGLYYLCARYYDRSMGRFINEDTYEGQIDNPLSFNLYTYVGNNPLIYYNPSGHSWKSIWNWTKNAAKTTLNLINEAAMAYPPLEGEVAQILGNKVVGFREKILGEARVVGDIDVETSKYIIEVTAGSHQRLPRNLKSIFNQQ